MKNGKKILRECIIPLLLILILLSVLFYRNARRETVQRGMISGEAENFAITVRQKGTKKEGGLISEKQTIDVEIIQDGLRNMSFLVTEEYYFTEVLSNKKTVSFLFPIGELRRVYPRRDRLQQDRGNGGRRCQDDHGQSAGSRNEGSGDRL